VNHGRYYNPLNTRLLQLLGSKVSKSQATHTLQSTLLFTESLLEPDGLPMGRNEIGNEKQKLLFELLPAKLGWTTSHPSPSTHTRWVDHMSLNPKDHKLASAGHSLYRKNFGSITRKARITPYTWKIHSWWISLSRTMKSQTQLWCIERYTRVKYGRLPPWLETWHGPGDLQHLSSHHTRHSFHHDIPIW